MLGDKHHQRAELLQEKMIFNGVALKVSAGGNAKYHEVSVTDHRPEMHEY